MHKQIKRIFPATGQGRFSFGITGDIYNEIVVTCGGTEAMMKKKCRTRH
ncbi:hypothetical protein [Blautia sp.]